MPASGPGYVVYRKWLEACPPWAPVLLYSHPDDFSLTPLTPNESWWMIPGTAAENPDADTDADAPPT